MLTAICATKASETVDTIVSLNGFNVRAVVENDTIVPKGLYLFDTDLLESENGKLYNFIEETLWSQINGDSDENSEKLILKRGSLDDFKQITPMCRPEINSFNSRLLGVVWNNDGKQVAVVLPVSYDTVFRGSRADIENKLITKLKGESVKIKRLPFEIDTEAFEQVSDTVYMLPGQAYQNRLINKNTYYFVDTDTLGNVTDVRPIFSIDLPLESMGNLFILPGSPFGKHDIHLRILKHEYGDIEDVEVDLEQLVNILELEGCEPFWGVEKFENGELQGALLFPNMALGYVHVFTVMCNPEEVIANEAPIRARTSLYVPVNNIDEKFYPEVQIQNPERPKYEIHID